MGGSLTCAGRGGAARGGSPRAGPSLPPGRVKNRRPELTQQVAEVQAPRDTLLSGSAHPRFPPGTIQTAEVSKTKED